MTSTPIPFAPGKRLRMIFRPFGESEETQKKNIERTNKEYERPYNPRYKGSIV